MNIPKLIIILISLLLLCSTTFSLRQTCNSNSCTCFGFESYCQLDTGLTILEFLTSSTSFVVQNINYLDREIRLLDPERCLADKLMHLDLASTPFEYNNVYNQNYTLYKCSDTKDEIVTNGVVHKIDCLSTPNYTVLAASWNYSMSSCDRLGAGVVALPVDYQRDLEPSNLVLTWSDGTNCRPELACPGDNYGASAPNKHKKVLMTVAIAVGLTLPVIVCITWCITEIITTRSNSSRAATSIVATTANRMLPAQRTATAHVVVTTGLDQPTLDSYPVVVIGESGRFLKSTDQEKDCSICLSDYQPKDTLKILPECLHKFHAHCIDEWLRAKALCPICRTIPSRIIL